VFIYTEACIKTKNENRIYFFLTAAFATFAWLFFLATFDLKNKQKAKVLDNGKNKNIEIEANESEEERFMEN